MIFTILFSLFIALVLYKHFIGPYLAVRRYAKVEGAKSNFFPILGFVTLYFSDLSKHNDIYYTVKKWQSLEKGKKPRFLVTNYGKTPFLILYDPELTKQYFAQENIYSQVLEVQGLFYDFTGNTFTVQSPELHKKRRAILSQTFDFNFLKSFVPKLPTLVRNNFDRMEKQNSMQKIDVLQTFGACAGDVILGMFLNEDMSSANNFGGSLTHMLQKLIPRISETAMDLRTFFFGVDLCKKLGFFKEVRKDIDETRKIVKDLILKKHEIYVAKGRIARNDDLTEILFKYIDDHPESRNLKIDDISDDCLAFFLAGTESTSTLMTLVLYMLAKNPRIQEKVREEVNQIYDKDNVTIEMLQKMDYMNATIKETMRFFPSLGQRWQRIAEKDHFIGDIKVQKGTMIAPDFIGKMHNTEYFEEPEKFQPERFLDGMGVSNPFVYLPFSIGTHSCIGQQLSNLETKLMLSEFLLRYDFDIQPDSKILMVMKIVYGPMDPILFNIKRRV